jgi:hypothetical protein
MEPEKFTTVIKIGVLEQSENNFCPAVLPMSVFFEMEKTPTIIAGFLTAVFDCVVDSISENEQIEFEKETLKLFKSMVKMREKHTEKINFKATDEDDD